MRPSLPERLHKSLLGITCPRRASHAALAPRAVTQISSGHHMPKARITCGPRSPSGYKNLCWASHARGAHHMRPSLLERLHRSPPGITCPRRASHAALAPRAVADSSRPSQPRNARQGPPSQARQASHAWARTTCGHHTSCGRYTYHTHTTHASRMPPSRAPLRVLLHTQTNSRGSRCAIWWS